MADITSNNPHERFIAQTEDSNTGSSFFWRPQGFPPRYGYYLTAQIEDHSGNTVGTGVEVRLNNDTTSNYLHVEYDGSAWTESTRDKFVIGFTNTDQPLFLRMFIGGGNYINEPSNAFPIVSANVATHTGTQLLHHGKLTVSYSTINDILIQGTANSTGWGVLEGWGPITER